MRHCGWISPHLLGERCMLHTVKHDAPASVDPLHTPDGRNREPHSNTSATFPAASNCATVLLIVNHLGLCGAQDFAVRHHDDAIGCSGKIPVMGDHEHGAAIVACELHQDSLYVG